MAEKWILAPPGKKGKNGRKMGKLAQKWVKNGHFPISRPFFPFFPRAKIHRPSFSRFGPEARFGVCTRQSGSQFQYRPHIGDTNTDCGRHFCGRHIRAKCWTTPRQVNMQGRTAHFAWEPARPLQRSFGPSGPEMPKKSRKCLPLRPAPAPQKVSKVSVTVWEVSGESPESVLRVFSEWGKHFRDFFGMSALRPLLGVGWFQHFVAVLRLFCGWPRWGV